MHNNSLDSSFSSISLTTNSQAVVESPLVDTEEVDSASQASIFLTENSNDCLKIIRTLQNSIPEHKNQKDERVSNYYQNCLQVSNRMKKSASEGILIKNEADTSFLIILSSLNTLFSDIEKYKSSSYQQKFDLDKYAVEIAKIDKNIENLNHLQNKLELLLKSLENQLTEDDGSILHLGTKVSEQKLQGQLGYGANEIGSRERLKVIKENLEKKRCDLKRFEQTKAASNVKIAALGKSISSLKDLYEQRAKDIIKIKEELITYEQQRESLKEETNSMYQEMIQKNVRDNEEQKKKVQTYLDNTLEEMDEIIKELTKKLASYSTMYTSIHYIFVLDHSSSMSGPRWNNLTKALDNFVDANKGQTLDLLSIIVFSDSAKEHMKKMKFSEYTSPVKYKWGGTNFDAAFDLTRDFCDLSNNHCPVVVFLTDGQGEMKHTNLRLREMNQTHNQKGFMFFAIGVGDDFNRETLKEITKIANNGKSYIDLGNDRIELLHTTKNENVLEKVFTEISASINGLSIKTKRALDSLKQAKIKAAEEAEERINSSNKISDEELKDVDLKYQKLLERRIKAVEEKEQEHKERIEFLERDNEECLNKVKTLEEEAKAESNTSTDTQIEALEKDISQLETDCAEASDELNKLKMERKKHLEMAQNSSQQMNFLTLRQSHEFFDADEKFQDTLAIHRTSLGKFKNFIRLIADSVDFLKEKLRLTNSTLNTLTEEGVLEHIFELYKNRVAITPGFDIPNMKKIACEILEISEKNEEKIRILELLFSCLHPRTLMTPDKCEAEHHSRIINKLKTKYEYELQKEEDELKKLEDEKVKIMKQIKENEAKQRDLQTVLEDAEKAVEKKEKEIRKLSKEVKAKKKISKNSNNKENIDTNCVSDSSDGEESEELLLKAQKRLIVLEKNVEEEEQSKISLRNGKKYLEIQINKKDGEIYELQKRIRESERQTRKITNYVLEYYEIIRNELMPRLLTKVHDIRNENLDTFKESLEMGLIKPIKSYFDGCRNSLKMREENIIRTKPALTN